MYAMPGNEESPIETAEDDDGKLHAIKTLSVSPQGKTLMCVAKRAQLFWAPMDGKVADVRNEVKRSTKPYTVRNRVSANT